MLVGIVKVLSTTGISFPSVSFTVKDSSSHHWFGVNVNATVSPAFTFELSVWSVVTLPFSEVVVIAFCILLNLALTVTLLLGIVNELFEFNITSSPFSAETVISSSS